MPHYNLLGSLPKTIRDVGSRMENKEKYREISSLFGEAYFDGPRVYGYGGYYYDGRWQAVAERALDRYKLTEGMKVLDVGCAKGFFINDLKEKCEGLEIYGVDISEYAISQAPPNVFNSITLANAKKLPFPDNYFDAVFSINVIHNIEPNGCLEALKEMSRICKNKDRCFVQVDAYRDEKEKQLFEAWMLTAKTYFTPEKWQELFDLAQYQGDYFWTILEFEDSSNYD